MARTSTIEPILLSPSTRTSTLLYKIIISVYLYGGYQVTLGVMSDFYRINMVSSNFTWEPITPSTKEHPGGRTRHSFNAHPTQSKLFLFGGQMQPAVSTNLVNYWDIDLNRWVRRKINSTYPPELDNHCSIACTYRNENLLIVLCGFLGGTIGLHSNCVFAYNMDSNDWVKLYPVGD